jgi:hypothetical protein
MADNDNETGGEVSVSVELSGSYDDVVSKLTIEEDEPDRLAPLVADLEVLLETLVRTGGGTRSVLADAIPDDTVVTFDGEAVVETMQVLERYDLVKLEGNTWKPGPVLQE